jgi:hypothetical protein
VYEVELRSLASHPSHCKFEAMHEVRMQGTPHTNMLDIRGSPMEHKSRPATEKFINVALPVGGSNRTDSVIPRIGRRNTSVSTPVTLKVEDTLATTVIRGPSVGGAMQDNWVDDGYIGEMHRCELIHT